MSTWDTLNKINFETFLLSYLKGKFISILFYPAKGVVLGMNESLRSHWPGDTGPERLALTHKHERKFNAL